MRKGYQSETDFMISYVPANTCVKLLLDSVYLAYFADLISQSAQVAKGDLMSRKQVSEFTQAMNMNMSSNPIFFGVQTRM